MSAEDDRAAAYREQQAARLAYKIAAEAALAPDPAVALAAWNAWKALLPLDEFGVPLAWPADELAEEEEWCSLSQ